MSESNRKASRQPPWEGAVKREAGAFGVWLRREREARDVTLDEIIDVTKISRAYLEALEDERFDVLPAPVFAKGFLREYAKYVGLDPDEVVNSYLTALQDGEPEPSGLEPAASRSGSSFEWTRGGLLALGLVLLLGGIGFLGFWAERSRRSAETATPQVEPMPAAEPEGAPPIEETEPLPVLTEPRVEPPPPASSLRVTLDFTEDCWVEATVDGRRRLSELHVQGESLQIGAEDRVELTLGNPGGVSIEVNGSPYPLPEYREGRVARDVVIEREAGE